ncbi:hypothetical protein [Leuconostoc mesenteroides]|uniref:hypothetical protein n=1 Tax=Leuconostoc mesenteroides TaxID=1245 RepID=UPI00235F07EE|nr:hypothetical protein [Leuconostoc mesenteroides]
MEEKKPWYKLPQLWVLVVFVVVIGIFIAIRSSEAHEESAKIARENSSVDKESRASSKKESIEESKADSSDRASEAAESESTEASSKVAEQEPTQYKTGVTFDQIARTPDDYDGKKIEFTGKVLQVMEDDDYTEIRLAVDGDYDNVILVDVDSDIMNGSRILEDDLVTVSGISDGTTTYESTSGANITIPAMTAKIINNQGKASDDYGY